MAICAGSRAPAGRWARAALAWALLSVLALVTAAEVAAEGRVGPERPRVAGSKAGAGEATEAQLDLIQQALRTASPSLRASLAAQLDRELGARATAAAIPRSFRYRSVRGRIIESSAYDSHREPLPFYIILPAGYDPGRPWPMHVYLHGGGFVSHRACRRFFRQEEIDGFILLCPTTPKAHWWTPEGEEAVWEVVQEAARRVNVDTDRISLDGKSSGATGVWHLGHKFPWRWSALVTRCGGKIREPRFLTNLADTPTFMIHGDEDHTLPVDLSREMASLLKARGMSFVYREVRGGGHDFFPALNAEVITWLARQRRAIPRRFAFEPTRHQDHGIIHWLELSPASPLQARIESDARGSVVSVSTQEPPRSATVYLNDALVDLDKPVRVVLNGAVVFEGVAARSTAVVLSSFAETFDARRTFSAAIKAR